uniref:Uncharacterized protein n=3 Tax=Parascaris univalens TaxID=6257 RepID=A0A915AWV4_PARUN
WLVLTHPPSQAIVGTQLVQPLQVGDTTQDSADALSVGNSSDFVVSAKGAESVAGTDQTHGLSTGTSTLKSSDHELAHETFVHTACVRGRVVPSGNMQDASLEERSCALSVVADADLVQTANISRSENSAAEKNFLANDHKSRSAGSVTKCSSSHGSEVLRLGQDRIMAMLDSGFADTNPKMVTENAQKLPTTENLIEDMPDVDNYEVVKKSGSSDADIVTLREGAVESSKPSGLNDIVDPAEGCSSPPTPEESSSSGLTLLFSGQDDSTRNIREEMSPPHTPCWHHSPGIIDDSASKTRFTDIDGSQAEWRRDEWRPRTPGQPVRPDDRGKRNCTKTKRSLLMNFENMASQRPATVDCGVQWEPVDVSSNHESSSSSNTSLYDVSVEDRLSGSVTQEENEGIIRESLEVKETEGDREGGQPNEEPKCKKRKRKERLRDGLKGMLNGEHRARQMRALSHVILGDFKQKMFMHQHKIQAIQQLITSGPPSTQMFQKLREILGDEHDLLLILVSFLFPEDLISESVLNDPIRKAYASAIEMILNIEAYATFGRSKFSARSIFRYIRELGPFCTSEELQARLYDVVGTEDPLWSALSTYLPTAPHPQMHQQYEYEHVDTASWDVASAEWEDVDMSYILKADTERRRKPAIIANGKLLVEKKGRLCEAIACFKCEEAVTIDGTEGDDCAVTSAEKFGNEFRADASEVEVVVERDYEENSFNATAGNQTLVKSCLGEMTATRKILSMESITDEDAEASEKLVDGENVTEKETKILAVDVEPVVKRGMDSPDRTLCMDLRSPGNEEVDGGIVGRDTFGKNFDKKLLGQRMSNEKTAGKVLSKWRTEENLTVKNGKQETLMEKWLKSKDADSICEGLDGVGWQSGGVLVDVEESIRSKKKALKCIDTQMSATSSNLGASFSEALKRGFEAKAASGLNNEVALCEQNPEKLCFVPGKTDVGAMEKGRSSNGERNKAISSKNNEKGEVVSKLRRSAENMDNSIFTADVRKKEKGEGDSKSASNALHGTGEREWVEGAQASYNIKYRNKERFFVQEARDERDRCTEHRKRRSEPGLAITSRADELYSRNSFREQAEPSVRHCEREPNVHWRSMNGVGHRESHFEVREPFGKKEYPDVTGDLRRREVIDDKGTFHRREHPEIERRPHRRQFDNRFGQSHRERNEEQLKRETTSRDEYTYICERDSLGREVWKKSWKRKTEDVVHHRWVSGTLRTDNTRFSHERSYDEVGRNSLGDGHKVSGDSRADRVVSRFGRREVPHQGRRHLDNWLREDSQRIDKNMRFIAEGRPYPDRSYKRAESRETSRQRSKSVRSVRTHFDVREEHPRTPSSDIRGKKYNFQELKKRVRHRNRCCDDTEVSMKRVRTPSMSTTGDHREPYSEERTLHTKVSRGVELEPGEVVSDESNDCTEVALHVMQRRTKDRQHNRVEAGSSSSKEAHVEYFGQRGQGEVPAVCSQDAIRSGLSSHKARGMEGESDESETVNERSEVFSSSKKDSEKRPSSTLSHKLSEMPKKLKAAWSREEDEELLHTYNQFDGDVEKVVCVLARTIHLRDLAEIKERLLFLLSLF